MKGRKGFGRVHLCDVSDQYTMNPFEVCFWIVFCVCVYSYLNHSWRKYSIESVFGLLLLKIQQHCFQLSICLQAYKRGTVVKAKIISSPSNSTDGDQRKDFILSLRPSLLYPDTPEENYDGSVMSTKEVSIGAVYNGYIVNVTDNGVFVALVSYIWPNIQMCLFTYEHNCSVIVIHHPIFFV